MNKAGLLALFLSVGGLAATAQSFQTLDAGRKTSIRGLSVLNDSVAWVSGSNGWVGTTSNRGRTWNWNQPEYYKTLDFRDIEAFSATEAIMVNAGSPAVILKTTDGGRTWAEVYRDNSPDIFLEGIAFWDKHHGLAFGDPIANQMQLLLTTDGGTVWTSIAVHQAEKLAEGEASFAASGTSIRTGKGGMAWLVTGGSRARMFITANYGKSWKWVNCPVIHGKSSQGPFSVDFLDAKTGIAVGGDYLNDTLRNDNVCLTRNGGKTWFKPSVNPLGYRSGVAFISRQLLICTGTSGTDSSADGGKTWESLSGEGFNSVGKSKTGNWVILAGSGGRIVSLNMRR